MRNCNISKYLNYFIPSKINILIIEDSKTLNNLLNQELSALGYNTSATYSKAQAIQLSQFTKFDYIILDLHLPDASGLTLLEEIKKASNSKIIILTDFSDEDFRSEIFNYGILDYLIKENSISNNIKEIHQIIQNVEKNKRNSILIVDDSNVILNKLKDLLIPRNYNIYTASNGINAYSILSVKDIDLVILDLELPDIHGLKLMKKIKNSIKKDISFLILSGNVTNLIYRDCIKNGAKDVLRKPYVAEEIILKTDLFIDNQRKNFELECSKELLEQYKNTVDRSFIVSKTDNKGIITYINEEFEKISKYTQKELIGKPHNIIRHEDMPSETFKELWETIKIKKEPWYGIVKNKDKSGNAYYVNTIINPILDKNGSVLEYIAIRNDITQLEETKNHFKSQYAITSNQFSEIINLSKAYEQAIDISNIIIKLDKNKKITHVNELFVKTFNYTQKEIVGTKYESLKNVLTDIEAQEIWKCVEKNGFWRGEISTYGKYDNLLHFMSTVIAIQNNKNETIEYIVIRQDITESINLHKELESTQREIIYKMGEIVETRSNETGNHVKRVAEYSKLMALKIGLSPEEAELLKNASPMHDIGKVGISDSILNKPAKLTDNEFEIMKSHTSIGYEILRKSNRAFLKAAAIVSHEHHEKYNGKGYPRGLKGENIHIYGRITALCDVFDALSTKRVYKEAWSNEEIFELIKKEKGLHFDPKLVDVFFENINEFLEIKEKYK